MIAIVCVWKHHIIYMYKLFLWSLLYELQVVMEPHRNYIAKTHRKLVIRNCELAITFAKVKPKYNLFSIIFVFTILLMKTQLDHFLKFYVSQLYSNNGTYGTLRNAYLEIQELDSKRIFTEVGYCN